MGRVFRQKSDATEYLPVAGDTFRSIVGSRCEAADPKISCEEVALYNWGTKEPGEVARALVELLGVRTWDDPDPFKWELDPARGIGAKLLLPKVMKTVGLAYAKVHKLKVKQQMPATAVSITSLDKWFLPGDETCDLSWEVEGVKDRASKLDFDVYASNYCSATATNQADFVDYAYADTPDVPIRQRPVAADVTERSTGLIGDWKGESEATEGVLKPRSPEKRYINAASSPYTAMLRYFEDEGQRKALLRVHSFWPRWSGNGAARAVVADSLRIKWHLKDCPDGMLGQFLIFDKDDSIVWRQAIPEAKCTNGDQEIDWSGDGTGLVSEANMPYRVQIQVHTNKDTSPGLALAGMHTEVRLYCHPDTGTFAVDHEQETQVLRFKQAPWLPGPAPAEDSAKGRKLRLARAGYHPGPVMDGEAQADYIRAIREFQRDHQQIGTNTRLRNDGTIDKDTKDAIAVQAANRRPLFADSARTDMSAAGAIEAALNDKARSMVGWVDDRHVYTVNAGVGAARKPNFSAKMDLGHYRDTMGIGDGKQTKDRSSICRAWLPVEVTVPIMRKSDSLDTASVPAINDNTRKATGPIRVDWTFRDLPIADNVDDSLYKHDRARPRKFVRTVVKSVASGATHNGKDSHNCPEARGGLRGADYYRALFGFGLQDSLAPWKGFDDSGNSTVCSVVHDDLGQDADRVFASHVGKAGSYLRPSIVGGDGYQFRAQVNFRALPTGATHPNWSVLRERYAPEKLSQAHSSRVRMWRKASLRAYVPWEPNADRHWGNGKNYEKAFRIFYEPCFVHFVQERPGPPVTLTPDQIFPAGAGETTYRTLIADNTTGTKGRDVKIDTFRPVDEIIRSTEYIWPWSRHKHLGINSVPPAGTTIANYDDIHMDTIMSASWRKYRDPLIHEAIKQIEQTQGVMRGHTIGEFRASPEYWVQCYYCDSCGTDQLIIELTAAGGSAVTENCRVATCAGHLITGAHRRFKCDNAACNRKTAYTLADRTGHACTYNCTGRLALVNTLAWRAKKRLMAAVKTEYQCPTCNRSVGVVETPDTAGSRAGNLCAAPCTGTFQLLPMARKNKIGGHQDMMSMAAAGMSMGGLWLFCTYPRGASTWAHEIGHHKHLTHGPGAGDYPENTAEHDSTAATIAPLNTFAAPDNQWDRVCMMGYTRTGRNAADKDRGYFCGKCILKLRGWRVNSLPQPGGASAGP